MTQMIRRLDGEQYRTGAFNGYAFRGLNCENGWLIGFSLCGSEPRRWLWITGTFDSLLFYSAAFIGSDEEIELEIDLESIEVTDEERRVLLGMLWEWEIWERVTAEGTCAIDSLVRMLDQPHEVLLEWFRSVGRDPSIQEDVIKTLEENGYVVEMAGPEGFGKFRDFRRLVSMFRKDNPKQGHVVLIYENDIAIFDAAGVFRKIGDIVWSDSFGYDRGPVWRIEKREA